MKEIDAYNSRADEWHRGSKPISEMTVQDLLDVEARLSNERYYIHKIIKAKRGPDVPPCWGHDDCSTNFLMRCPWRIDCEEGRDGA